MNQDLQKFIQKEKNLSAYLRRIYLIGFSAFFFGLYILFNPPINQEYILASILVGIASFVVILYTIIVKLLFNHRNIAKLYQQEFPLSPMANFGDCKTYLQKNDFTLYVDDKIIIANKLLPQKHTGRIRRDYLLQIVVTANEFPLDVYMQENSEKIKIYHEEFQKLSSQTKNKIITVGCHLHFVPDSMPLNLLQQFKVQAKQRYLPRFDMIVDEKQGILYYPSHIESYKMRSWNGQLIPEPYNLVADFMHTVFLSQEHSNQENV